MSHPKRSKRDIKTGVKSNKDVRSEDIKFENDKALVVQSKRVCDVRKYGKKGNWCISSDVGEHYFFPKENNYYIIYPKVNLNKIIPEKDREYYGTWPETEPEDPEMDILVPRDLSIIAVVKNVEYDSKHFNSMVWSKNNLVIPTDVFSKILKILNVPRNVFKLKK